MDGTDLDGLRTFRTLAQEVRNALPTVREAGGAVRVVGGYLESRSVLQSYRPLCLPVRRTYRRSDRASFVRVCGIVERVADGRMSDRVASVEAAFNRVMADVTSSTILNDRQVRHADVFDAWLDAVIFGSFGDRDRDYSALVQECGKAVEGIAVRLTEAVAQRILDLDELVADVLEER
jgi:hypothetical protein